MSFERLSPKVILVDGKYYRAMNDTEIAEFIWHEPETKEILQWIYARLTEVYGESPNSDYMIKFNEVISNCHGLSR